MALGEAELYKELRSISEADENRVVRIHCQGAIRATEQARLR